MRRYLPLIVAAVFAGAAAWAYFSFERVTERVFVGFHGEAARNPLLALQRLVERMDVPARKITGLEDLQRLPPAATLILADGRQGMSLPRAERLARWVADGGHLVVEAENPERRDTVLTALKVGRRGVRGSSMETTVEITLPAAQLRYRVLMPLTMELTDAGTRKVHAVTVGEATAFLEISHGAGRVTVLPSFAFLSNARIGELDHADFAWDLLQLGSRPSLVLIAPHTERPSLLEWLTHEAFAPLAAMLVLLALWLWRESVRFGPVLTDAEPQRRRLLDHLRASGHFLWSTAAAGHLLAAAREVCLAKIARSRPALAGLTPAERIERYASLAEIAPEEVDRALNGTPTTPRAFTATVRTLQQIEERLTRRSGA